MKANGDKNIIIKLKQDGFKIMAEILEKTTLYKSYNKLSKYDEQLLVPSDSLWKWLLNSLPGELTLDNWLKFPIFVDIIKNHIGNFNEDKFTSFNDNIFVFDRKLGTVDDIKIQKADGYYKLLKGILATQKQKDIILSTNETNPFRTHLIKYVKKSYVDSTLTFYLPDITELDKIYKYLNVSSFEELFPSQKDYDQYIVNSFFNKDITFYYLRSEIINKISTFVYINASESLLLQIANDVKTRLIMKPGKGDVYKNMPKDVFRHIVLTGELKGQDLIALCGTDQNIKQKCDSDDYWLFKQLLFKEFDLKRYPKSRLYNTPRDLYVLLHQIKDCWQSIRYRFGVLSAYYDILNNGKYGLSHIANGELIFPSDIEYDYTIYDLLYNYDNKNSFLTNYRGGAIFAYKLIECYQKAITSRNIKTEGVYDIDIVDVHDQYRKLLELDGKVLDDIEDNWFEIREDSHYSKQEQRQLDDFWDVAPKIINNCLNGTNIDFEIRGFYTKYLGKLALFKQLDDVNLAKLEEIYIDNFNGNLDEAKETFVGFKETVTSGDIDLLHISDNEVKCLTNIHYLVMDGVLSITMKLKKFI